MANTNDNRIVACGGGGYRGAMSWTDIECAQFKQGVILHGWGNWIAMAQSVIPTRDRSQVKSHAQKFRQNHTADYERLLREHEARRRVNFPGVVVGSGRGKADTEKRRKTPPRRRASTTKAKTRAVRTNPRSFHRSATADVIISLSGRAAACPKPHEILRGNGNIVATSSMKSATAKGSPKMKITRMQPSPFPCGSLSAVNNVVGLATLDGASPASPSPKFFDIMPTARKPMPPRHVGVLSDVTNDIRHATLGHSAPASTSTAFFDVEFPDRRHHAFEASIHEYPPNYDEMPALVTTVTPSSGTMPACCKSMHNASALFSIHSDDARMYTDVFGDYASLSTEDVIDRAGNEDIIDPLYQLEMDDHRLDTIGDLLEPSCNVMFDQAIKGGMLPQGIDSHNPFAVASNNGIGLVEWTMTSGRSEAFQIPPIVRPHRQLFMQVRSLLTSPPDVNNPEELGCAGMCRGSLCRARIKTKLGEHLTMCWWREYVFADQSGVIQSALGTLGKVVEGGVDVRIGEVQNGTIPFKKFALERLVALIAAMLDVDHWHALRVGNSSPANANTISDDDDDIRHVGQLLSGLWERVSRSRDGFALLGGDIQERTERNEAINTLVARLDLISRHEHIKSRRVPSYDHGWRV